MLERQQATQEDARKVQENGGVVIYWRPGCPFCERLDSSLGDLGNHATWVNIWEDPQAEAHVKSLNEGNAVVPTLDTGDMHFVVADRQTREKAATLIATLFPNHRRTPLCRVHHLNRDTTLCISLSRTTANHGIKFHNYLYEKHGLDYLYKAMTTTDI